jgi:hypothetical protein
MSNVYIVLIFKNSFTLLTINFAEIPIVVDHTFKDRNYFFLCKNISCEQCRFNIYRYCTYALYYMERAVKLHNY